MISIIIILEDFKWKTSVLTTTTLAGALLFSGVGAHQAHAAESEVTANNATEIGSSVMKEHGYHPENVNFREPEDKGIII